MNNNLLDSMPPKIKAKVHQDYIDWINARPTITEAEIVAEHNEAASYEPSKIQTIVKFDDLFEHQQAEYYRKYNIVRDNDKT